MGSAPSTPARYRLLAHQEAGRQIARDHQTCLYAWDTGTGKTLLALSVVEDSWPCRALVVCPYALVRGAWGVDAARFTPDLPFHDLGGASPAKRQRVLADAAPGLYVTNYETWRVGWAEFARVPWDLLILDESSKLKNPQAQVTKRMVRWAPSVPRRYLLSGTPWPNTLLEAWAQGLIVGAWPKERSYYAWRAKIAQPGGYGGYQWVVTPEGYNRVMAALSRCSQSLSKGEVLDLPERTYRTRPVDLDSYERRVYRQMRRHKVAELDVGTLAAPMVLTQLAKLRQITSGFVYREGETHRVGESKLREAAELLEEIGPHQVLLWAHYQEEFVALKGLLGEKLAEYHGQVPQNERQTQLDLFTSGRRQYLAASPASIGHGVTLTNASYCVWYSLSYSYEQYHQACDRIYRHGQRNACTYYHLVAPGTVDELMLACCQDKADRAALTLSYLSKVVTTQTATAGGT